MEEESKLFIYLNIISLFLILVSLRKKLRQFLYAELVLLILALIVVFLNIAKQQSLTSLQLQFLFVVLGSIFAYKHYLFNIDKDYFIKFILILCSLLTASSLIILLSSPLFEIGGKERMYQLYSYNASFRILILIHGLFISRFFNKTKYQIIGITFILINFGILFIYGGRGAFLVLFIYTIVNFKKLFKLFLPAFLFTTCTIYLSKSALPLNITDLFSGGLSRILSLTEKISLGNRQEPWIQSMEIISNNPLFGVGYLQVYNLIHPHNIILHIILQLGIPLGILLIVILFRLHYQNTKQNNLISILTIYVFVMLFFSGNYLQQSTFWFLSINAFFQKKYA